MGLLQAARAYTLGLPLESAYSWGLNRAIFIAAAKRGFKGGSGSSAKGVRRNIYALGDDEAYKASRGGALLFVIGGEVQTKDEFEKRIASRFGKGFSSAWQEALDLVGKFDRDVLASREAFYSEVYRPVRDHLAEKWSEMAA